jgi:hypothetical protein
MPDGGVQEPLDRECVTFARYLTGQVPTGYVLGKYRDAHVRSSPFQGIPTAFEDWLVRAARSGTFGISLVDAYTAVFLRKALVRKKWVLLIAILESSPAMSYFDSPDVARRGIVVARLSLRCMAFALALCVSVVIVGPVHLALSAGTRR